MVTYLIIFISVVTATSGPYTMPSLIPVDDYVRVQSFFSHHFILCLYVVLDRFFAGIGLDHISNTP